MHSSDNLCMLYEADMWLNRIQEPALLAEPQQVHRASQCFTSTLLGSSGSFLSILDEEYARGPAFREQVQDDFPRRLRLGIASVQTMNNSGKQVVGPFVTLPPPQVIFLCSTRLRGSYIMQSNVLVHLTVGSGPLYRVFRSLYILIVGPGIWARLAQLHGA